MAPDNILNFCSKKTIISQANVVELYDSNPKKWDTEFHGYRVCDPESINTDKIDVVIISSRTFQDEIYKNVKHLKNDVDIVRLYNSEKNSMSEM